MTIKMSMREYNAFDYNEGICIACKETADGVEPDAENYECAACGEKKVFGLEQAVIIGHIEIIEDDDDEEDEDSDREDIAELH